MSERTSNVDVKIGSERNFGVVFTVVFAIVGLWPLIGGGDVRVVALALAAAIAAITVTAPDLLRWPNRLWFRFGLLLGHVVAPIVMGLVFLTTFVPIGLGMRAAGRDLLSVRLQPDAASYWIDRKKKPGSMKQQF